MLGLVWLLAISAPAPAVAPYWPNQPEWRSQPPEQAGFDVAALEDALGYAQAHNSTGVVVVRHGRIVAERYWRDWNKDTAGPIFSASKSITSTLVGQAIDDGRIRGVRQSMADFVPSWKGTPKEAVTVRHVLSMVSGIQVGRENIPIGVDQFQQTAALPLEHPPGTLWAYSTPMYRMLLHVIELATGESLPDYTRRKLTGPIGMEHGSWDSLPAPGGKVNWTWFRCSVRDMCRFGLLALHQGKWDGTQLVSAQYMKAATTVSQELNQAYGYLWWLNGGKSFLLPGAGKQNGMLLPDCPPDAFAALGAQDKKIYVVPSLDLVVARHGGGAGVARRVGPRESFDNQLLGRICRSLKR